jgi:hypothetical protein
MMKGKKREERKSREKSVLILVICGPCGKRMMNDE